LLETVNDPSEIPAFADETEERAFWATHRIGPGMLAADDADTDPLLEAIPVRPRTRPVPIRFDDDTLTRLKALAARKGIGYQTLVRAFVTERLYEEEKRAGILGR
jgi:hypothetical protein